MRKRAFQRVFSVVLGLILGKNVRARILIDRSGNNMNVVIACEESGAVRREFAKRGHKVTSVDLLPTSTPVEYPGETHVQSDIYDFFQCVDSESIDILIGFPPCDHLCASGARWWKEKQKDGRQEKAKQFFMYLAEQNIPRIALENPIGIMSTSWRKPDQIIQPWQFGHGETKATCLWLKGLPKLTATNVVEGREARIHRMSPSKDRSMLRSKTYPGIAVAMATQWG